MHLRTEYWREYRHKNILRKREIERKSQERPASIKRRKAYNAEYQRQNRERIKLVKARFPKRVRAREKLRYEVRIGRIKRLPCVECGDPKSEAHHTDYSKPLDVTWLCRKHHRSRERTYH